MAIVERFRNKKTLEEEAINECKDVNTAVDVSVFTLLYNYKSEHQDNMYRLFFVIDCLH